MQRAVISAAALALAVAGCAGRRDRLAHEHGAPATDVHQMTDTRRQISLTPAERDAVLAEIRTMLGSVSGVLHGMTAHDHQAIERAARASGMAMAVDPRLQRKLPQQFLELGMATHKKFDQLAALATTRAPADQVVRSLANVTTSRVTCRSMYRFWALP